MKRMLYFNQKFFLHLQIFYHLLKTYLLITRLGYLLKF